MITAEPSSRAMTISFTIWIRTDQFRIREAPTHAKHNEQCAVTNPQGRPESDCRQD